MFNKSAQQFHYKVAGATGFVITLLRQADGHFRKGFGHAVIPVNTSG